ncbi:unnamed protein product [Blepharisma stoltei]|uniref:Uncharacterized protein n=1 Tax=Blepharisma stoltei TaxID=1481888 RepID=A0AAU9JU63_9CILI|nr:unnamed protein product [Blepharisma stoltei]
MKNCAPLTLFFIAGANIILTSRILQIETGETFALQSVNSEEAANIESVMGCPLKCVDICFQFTKGIAAAQCPQQCGCKHLLTPELYTQLKSGLLVQIDDVPIIQQKQDPTDIEAEKAHFDGSTESHIEVEIVSADPNNKEFAYRKVSTRRYNRIEESPINEEAKIISQIKNGATIEDSQESNIEKAAFNNYENQENSSGSYTSTDLRTETSINQGSVYKEIEINRVIIKPIQKKLSSCELDCSSFCKEATDNKESCKRACNANFCEKNPAKMIANKPDMKSFWIWGWIITIAILGVAVSMFLNKVAGGKPRKVELNDFTQSSASYKILV